MAQIRLRGKLWGFFYGGGFTCKRYKSGSSNSSRLSPPDIPWVLHRIVTSKYYRASLIEVEKHWSIDDVAHAHQALDYFAHCEYLQMRAIKNTT